MKTILLLLPIWFLSCSSMPGPDHSDCCQDYNRCLNNLAETEHKRQYYGDMISRCEECVSRVAYIEGRLLEREQQIKDLENRLQARTK